jgi:hypothetical protein
MSGFADLIASRLNWIEQTLKPWCRVAALKDLKRAELEWEDIAGKVDPKATLWTWAWGRFPNIVHEGLAGVDETHAVRVTLKSGQAHTGYPDNRKSEGGRLVLLSTESTGTGESTGPGESTGTGRIAEIGPISIDDIAQIERAGF